MCRMEPIISVTATVPTVAVPVWVRSVASSGDPAASDIGSERRCRVILTPSGRIGLAPATREAFARSPRPDKTRVAVGCASLKCCDESIISATTAMPVIAIEPAVPSVLRQCGAPGTSCVQRKIFPVGGTCGPSDRHVGHVCWFLKTAQVHAWLAKRTMPECQQYAAYQPRPNHLREMRQTPDDGDESVILLGQESLSQITDSSPSSGV